LQMDEPLKSFHIGEPEAWKVRLPSVHSLESGTTKWQLLLDRIVPAVQEDRLH